MAPKLILRELSLNDEEAFLKGLEAFEEMDLSWYSFIWKPGISFKNLLQVQDERSRGINLAAGLVRDSMLYAFVDGKIVGRSSIRHELNDHLLKIGGHIGYAVAPEFRMKGYATLILDQSLAFCRETLKLSRVLVTCDDDNIGSIKTIEKNGGVLENTIIPPNKTTKTRRYWIDL